ncbi:MAG: hypothetical protein J6J76_05305 [Paraprevotella sp.]|nr:hypothetical protein [Paraprevotella sp.]
MKINYTAPKVMAREMEIVCMLEVSASGSLDGTTTGGSSSGGMDADANIRNEWDEGLW